MTSMGSAVRWILGTVTAASLLIFLLCNDAEAQGPKQTPNPRQAMVSVLSASSPHPSLGDEARVWDRFIGTWDCAYTFFLDDGSIRHSSGELEFGWIMDGRAVQDIWITYPKEAGKERGIGTTVRFFDSKSKMWRIVFVGPAYGALVTLQGGTEGDRIVLRGVDDENSMLRWSFNDITSDSFIWRGEKSRDGGKTWKLEEEHRMKRRGSGNVTAKASSEGMNDHATGMIPTPEKTNSVLAFEQLASLVGEWKEMQGDTEITLIYTLTADGSALMEEFRAAQSAMVTMFTVDGDHIIATHYCSAGNQPQMVTKAITEPLAKSVTFSLSRVTGLKTPGDWHNTGLTVRMEDKQHLTQVWTYEYNGKTGTNTFHFTRTR